jgi:hypothetical protein
MAEPKSLEELYKLWNDSQSYIAEQNENIEKEVVKLNENVQKLVSGLKKMNDNMIKLLDFLQKGVQNDD